MDGEEGGADLVIDATQPKAKTPFVDADENIKLEMHKGEVTSTRLMHKKHHTPKQSIVARFLTWLFGYEDDVR